MTWGDCTAVGKCFYSPHFPGSYGNYEGCTIKPLASSTLHVANFSLESIADYMRITDNDGWYEYRDESENYDDYMIDDFFSHDYEATGPDGVFVTPESEIDFGSSYYYARLNSRSKICFDGFPTPAPSVSPAPQCLIEAHAGAHAGSCGAHIV